MVGERRHHATELVCRIFIAGREGESGEKEGIEQSQSHGERGRGGRGGEGEGGRWAGKGGREGGRSLGKKGRETRRRGRREWKQTGLCLLKGGAQCICTETTLQAKALPVYWACVQGWRTLPGLQRTGHVCLNANTHSKFEWHLPMGWAFD